jgi:hypothetical protein
MATRTTTTTVSFSSPFMLPSLGEPQAAGECRIDTDEESHGSHGAASARSFICLESGRERRRIRWQSTLQTSKPRS